MQLTARVTETLVRRFASASKAELQSCYMDLKQIACDFEQPAEVRLISKQFATTVRRQLKRFES